MKNHTRTRLLVVGLLILPGLVHGGEAISSHYKEMSGHYEAIRLALLADSMAGVAEHARGLREQASSLRENFSVASAGISEDEMAAFSTSLDEIEASAMKLVEISDLSSARDEFFVLTRPMAKYRKLTGDQSTVVAYCSMAQKAWIQPQGEIGNPYYGQGMPRCGEVLAD
jgi:hypothetical protein